MTDSSPARALRARPAAGAPATATGTTANCPWLNTHFTIARRVAMVMSHMTLADKITMVEGQGTGQPYVFYMAAQPKLCIPAMGLEDGPVGVGDGLTGVSFPRPCLSPRPSTRPWRTATGRSSGPRRPARAPAPTWGPR